MKYLLSILVLVGCFAFAANNVKAQSASTTQILSEAVVVSDFAVQALSDLNFGFILNSGDEVTITPNDNNAGSFLILSSKDIDITITATPLLHDGGTREIPFTHYDFVRMVDVISGNQVSLNLDGTITSPTMKLEDFKVSDLPGTRFQMFVGGTISTVLGDPANDPAFPSGRYEGTVTVTLEEAI